MKKSFSNAQKCHWHLLFKQVLKGYLISIMWFASVQGAYAVPDHIPPDVFEAKPGGYLYADYPGVFDDFDPDGLTIEAWVYFNRPGDHDAEEGAYWFVLGKPGSYFFALKGRTLTNEADLDWPNGTVWVQFRTEGQHDDPRRRSWGIASRRIERDDFPLRSWVHLGIQIMPPASGFRNNWFFDKQLFTTASKADAIARVDTPFLVGGFMYIQMPWGEWGHLFNTMEGYIDEVHISRGLCYGRNRERIRTSRNFRRDDSTIALWRFEEGPGAPIYRDSFDNGHHLVPGGSLAVGSHGMITTLWGNIKTR